MKRSKLMFALALLAVNAQAEDKKMVVCDPVSFATIAEARSWDISIRIAKDIPLEADKTVIPLNTSCSMTVKKETYSRTLKPRKLKLQSVDMNYYGDTQVFRFDDPTVFSIFCSTAKHSSYIKFEELRKLITTSVGLVVDAPIDPRCTNPVDAFRFTDQRELDSRMATQQSDQGGAKRAPAVDGQGAQAGAAAKKSAI